MSTHGTLAVFLDPGQQPQLAEPVPDLALVSLDVFLSPRLREWVTLHGSDVELCGHRFRIEAWEQDCLVWRHVGSVA